MSESAPKTLRELSASETGPEIDPASFGFKTTRDVAPLDGIVGQPRALRAIDLGLAIRQPGYHLYMSGMSGTGRMELVRRAVTDRARHDPVPEDWIYVNNFEEQEQPSLLSLPAGVGTELQSDMKGLISRLLEEIPKAFQREDFSHEKDRLRKAFKDRSEALFEELNEEAKKRSFSVQQVAEHQMMFTPLRDGHPISDEEAEKLSPDELKEIDQRQRDLMSVVERIAERQSELEQHLNSEVRQVERSFANTLVEPFIAEIARRYANDRVTQWLGRLKAHFLKNLERFRRRADRLQKQAGEKMHGEPLETDVQERFFEYQVNVLVSNRGQDQAPVVIESAPTYRNLFGTVDRIVDRLGHVVTNFTRIKAGSLHRANGGYLVFHLADALAEPYVWRQLKRVLKSGQIAYEDYDPFSIFSVSALKPEPMPLNVKLVVLGHPMLYRLLYQHDEDFREIFRIKADFDDELDHEMPAGLLYAQLIQRLSLDEQLPPFDAEAVGELVRISRRIAGDQRKLTAQFRRMIDLIREAAFWAQKDHAEVVTGPHVRQTLSDRVFRSDMIATRIRQMIHDETLLISLAGTAIGQVNGLAVADMGDYAFGWPMRLTASVGVGAAGVINIERESRLSGRSFDKGMLILEGFLRSQYASRHPIALSASLAMEQSYSGIDGDSASAAELICLLSAIGEIPLRQDLALTGSINQRGEIQAIGGVNEKVEGFFDICREHGLSGHQGVCIPAANVQHLILRHDVVEAVRLGQFHIWAVRQIDEVLELFSGRPAGTIDDLQSVHGQVDQRLKQMLQTLKSNRGTVRKAKAKGSTEQSEPTEPGPQL
ncbi:MAG: AAA family ATPase [Planctomycetaceae bacterium]